MARQLLDVTERTAMARGTLEPQPRVQAVKPNLERPGLTTTARWSA
jgi:hypothetical protein